MPRQKRGRHAPAFILLMIAKEPTHGLGILNLMDEHVPNHRMDTAIVYRTLKDLEKEGYIVSQWADSDSGPKKKIYELTPNGRELLSEFKADIEKSINNLEKFLTIYKLL